ncbi:MAG TPA: tetratricopeptide repeat protein [Alphaproteobacteria bacterium]|nr:tetratricopeptide repeat protein [Alphaproteobacteria bacterium]
MSDTDVFREVDEDYRRERMMIFWRRYGGLVLALAIIVVGASGVADYLYRRTQAQKAVATAEFETLISTIRPGNEGKDSAMLEAFAAKSDKGLAVLARMAEASLQQRAGDLDAAARLYHQIADDSSVDGELRDLAVVRLGYLAADQTKPEPLIPRLGPIAGKDGPWRYSAKEAIALLTARAGQRESAAAMFSELADDPNAPPDLASRARALAELYRGK